MNKFCKLIFTLLIFILTVNYGKAGSPPTFNMMVRNVSFPFATSSSDSVLEFDVYCQQTNFGAPGVDPFEYCAGQFTWYFNKALLQNDDVTTFSLRSSALPLELLPPTFGIDTVNGYLKASGNIPTSFANYFISSVFPGTFMARYRLKTTGNHWPSLPINLKFKLGSAPNTFIAYFLPYADSVDTESIPPPQQTIVSLLDTLVNIYSVEHGDTIPPSTVQKPVANFIADSTSIDFGRSVDFTDLSTNVPTSWSWSFPGGTPSSSNVKNPASIVYSVPGIYSVTLTATNDGGSNTLTKTNYITVSECGISWANSLIITDAGNVKDSLKFGTAPSATSGIDPCLGEIALPPAPPTGAYDIRFLLSGNASKIDIRKDSAGDKVWILQFQPSPAGYPITFNWNPSAFPPSEFFYLKDLIGGSIVNVNMNVQSSYILTNAGIGSLRIESNNKTTKSISLNSGWNILSVPVFSNDMKVTSLFPTAISAASTYNGTYITVDSLKNGKGYWLKFSRDTTYNVLGVNVNPKIINVTAGWNMIGPFDENIPVSSIISSPLGIINSSFYGFSNMYYTTDTLKQGKGYWVNSTSSGTLTKSITLRPSTPVVQNSDSIGNWTRITFTDRELNSLDVYLTKSDQITQNYDLPPVPPNGIFDVRFSSGRNVEEYGKAHGLSLSSAQLPLKIRISNSKNHRLRVADRITGELFNTVLEEGIEYELTQNMENLMLTDEGIIPDQYSLGQNYPNPFNPSTTIKYDIPLDGTVKIIIYDLLGKEIKLLENKFMKAGSYELKFNGSDLSSGIYIYKMQSGSFTEIKRMVLIK